uniref:Putative secreted protein n=1 Tax=Anopheles darlingi TaxID=43151 RepID=A0A2M4DF91_ANODA
MCVVWCGLCLCACMLVFGLLNIVEAAPSGYYFNIQLTDATARASNRVKLFYKFLTPRRTCPAHLIGNTITH